MEDLDLDELDQAVNQIMDKPKDKKARKNTSAEIAVAQAPPQPEAATQPTVPASRPLVTPSPVSRPLVKPAPRKRMRTGAMDIVQRPAAPSRPKRESPALQPVKPIVPEAPQPQPTPAAVQSAEPLPSSPPAPTQDVSDDLLASLNMHDDRATVAEPKSAHVTPEQSAESWPDPLDFHDFSEPSESKDHPHPEPKPEEPPTLQSPPEAPQEPVSSPFVTTKVEKRPLGAYANVMVEPETVESAPEEEPTKAELAEASLKSDQHITPSRDADPEDLRPMAIPQQYHTAQAKPTDALRPVFDTKEYHAPPQPMHTERRGSPWFVVAVVILIVLIVAVASVGYLMMTNTDLITF